MQKILPDMRTGLKDVLIRVLNYIRYVIVARNPSCGRIRSQSILEFVRNTFVDKEFHTDYALIHQERQKLLKKKILIPVSIYGAGPHGYVKTRTLRDVVKRSSVSEKHGRLLYRISKYYKPEVVVELGTSTGLSTLYLALGHPDAQMITIEGNPMLCGIASGIFKAVAQDRIELMNITFEEALSLLDNQPMERALIFIDGNHTYEATRKYFDYFIGRAAEPFMMILHDINWSCEMTRIWNEIKSDPKVKTTIDLYYLGIVCNFKHFMKQNFVLRY
ncbi:MAG: class I SAM-dependent methyltransferase [Bacteroidales bacterium]|nr:class I SAM-dependent methyltransferase [Bacteroidales bacterium]